MSEAARKPRRRNMTITLEDEVARWARIKAAEKDTSVSRLVGDMLKEKMQDEQPTSPRCATISRSSSP